MLRSEAAVGGVIRLSTVTEPDVPWEVELADTPKHSQVGFEEGKETLRPTLMHVPSRVFLLRMIHERMYVAFHLPIAAGRVRVEPAARLDGKVRRLLHGLHGAICGRLEGRRGSIAPVLPKIHGVGLHVHRARATIPRGLLT